MLRTRRRGCQGLSGVAGDGDGGAGGGAAGEAAGAGEAAAGEAAAGEEPGAGRLAGALITGVNFSRTPLSEMLST